MRGVAVRFISGRSLSAFGHQMTAVAVGWEIYERTHSALHLGLVGLAQVVPVVVLSLLAGATADRFDRRNVALLSTLALALGCLALGYASHVQAPLVVIYSLLFLIGVCVAFRSPSQGAILPSLVDHHSLVKANAYSASAYEIASITGPGLAGFAIAWLHGSTWIFVFDAACQLGMVAVLASLPSIRAQQTQKEPLAAGVHFLRQTPLLLSAITLDMFAVLFGGAVALLPIFAKDVLQTGPEGLGWLRAAPSIGALIMALFTTRMKPWQHAGKTLLLTVAGFGLMGIGFALSRNFYLSFAFLLLSGLFDNVSVVIRITLEQTLTPERLRGRVSAIHYVFIGLSNELGSFESGLTAEWMGARESVLFGSVVTLLVVLVVWRVWPELSRVGSLQSLLPSQSVVKADA